MLSAFITQPIVWAAKGNRQSSKIMSVGEEIHFSSGMTLPTSLMLLMCLWINGDKSAGDETGIQKCLRASPVSAFDNDSPIAQMRLLTFCILYHCFAAQR